jgi:hypothetical protein
VRRKIFFYVDEGTSGHVKRGIGGGVGARTPIGASGNLTHILVIHFKKSALRVTQDIFLVGTCLKLLKTYTIFKLIKQNNVKYTLFKNMLKIVNFRKNSAPK